MVTICNAVGDAGTRFSFRRGMREEAEAGSSSWDGGSVRYRVGNIIN